MAITLERDFVPGTHKVVHAHEVEFLTSVGWRIVRVMETTVPIKYTVKGAEQGNQANGWINTQAQVLEEVGTVPVFLVAQHHDTEMATLREQLQKSQESEEAAKHSAASGAAFVKKLSADCAQEKTGHAATKASLNETCEQLRKSREYARKVEADIGKLRSALGELRMKEILESK